MNKQFIKLCLSLMLTGSLNVQAAVNPAPSIPTALVGSISASQEMPITEEVRKQINNSMQKASLDHPDASITYFNDGIYVEIYIWSEFEPKKVGIDDILESLSTQSWISKLKKLQMMDTIFDIGNLKNVLSKTPYLKNLKLITNTLYKMGENDLKDLNLALSKLGNLEELTLNFNDFKELKLSQTLDNWFFEYMNSGPTYLDKMNKMIEKGLKPLGKFISSYQYIISGKDVMTMLLTIKDMKKIKKLYLYCNNIPKLDEKDFEILSNALLNHPELEVLSFSCAKNPHANLLPQFLKARNSHILNLSTKRLGDMNKSELRSLIKALSLIKMSDLNELDLSNDHLNKIAPDEWQIFMEVLSNMPVLQVLNLRNNGIKGPVLNAFINALSQTDSVAGIPNLRSYNPRHQDVVPSRTLAIDFRNNGISAEERAALQFAMTSYNPVIQLKF